MTTTIATPAGHADFDFLFGTWRVHHRRLDRRLAGCTHWTTFEGRTSARPLLGGIGNIDENVLELPAGRYEAVTFRFFDATTASWSIWWVDGRDPQIDTPMRGSFVDGFGAFHGDDTFDGRAIRVRFVWSDITAVGARWEQAFSTDDGTSWEVNWVMRFERVA